MTGFKLMKEETFILGINHSLHNASCALLKNNEIIFHLESERISNIKHDGSPFLALKEIEKITDTIDYIALCGFDKALPLDSYRENDAYTTFVLTLNDKIAKNNVSIFDLGRYHHDSHAASSFYNSGFNEALCIVFDGLGSRYYKDEDYYGREFLTSLVFSYPNNSVVVDKHISSNFGSNEKSLCIEENVYIRNSYSIGISFEHTAKSFGFNWYDAGKIMGMSAYGSFNKNFKNIILENGFLNNDFFYRPGEDGENNLLKINLKQFKDQADFSYMLQKQSEDFILSYVLKMLEKTNQKNICLSGGFFLNCVSNYNLLKNLPKNINIYIEPISSDAGTAIGSAQKVYYFLTKDNKKNIQKNIFYGPKYNLSLKDIEGYDYSEVSDKDVARLISEKNIVAIYQGGSESGPRALGNRSILYDPRDKDGKEKVNLVKKREWFRPFAGSILQEHAQEWFNLYSLSESKFMMYAVDIYEEKKNLVPAIVHVDGTCRIQTVTQEDNKNFYNLIKEFYNITEVPILFNTSFNLAGNAMVETIQDALKTLDNSKIEYLYLPELKILVRSKNDY
jgi:carbamoyltransferase